MNILQHISAKPDYSCHLHFVSGTHLRFVSGSRINDLEASRSFQLYAY